MNLANYILSQAIAGTKAGLTNFVESLINTSPNVGVNVAQLEAKGDTDSVDIVLSPKGYGAILAQVPDGTTTGGSKRGDNSVDLQMARSSYSQVVTGDYSFAVGSHNSVGGDYSASLGGRFNNITGTYAASIAGTNNTVTGEGAVAMGILARATRPAQFAQSSRGGGQSGTAQACNYVLTNTTNSSAPTKTLSLTGSGVPETLFAVDSSQSIAFSGVIIASAPTSGEGKSKAWEITGAVHRVSTGAAAFIGTPTVTVIGADLGTEDWNVDISVDGNNFKINATGYATGDVRFGCNLRTAEVVF